VSTLGRPGGRPGVSPLLCARHVRAARRSRCCERRWQCQDQRGKRLRRADAGTAGADRGASSNAPRRPRAGVRGGWSPALVSRVRQRPRSAGIAARRAERPTRGPRDRPARARGQGGAPAGRPARPRRPWGRPRTNDLAAGRSWTGWYSRRAGASAERGRVQGPGRAEADPSPGRPVQGVHRAASARGRPAGQLDGPPRTPCPDGCPAGRPSRTVHLRTLTPCCSACYRNGSSDGRGPLVGCSQRMYCSASQPLRRSRSSARA
jgi:hypothetical protein